MDWNNVLFADISKFNIFGSGVVQLYGEEKINLVSPVSQCEGTYFKRQWLGEPSLSRHY